MESLEFTGRESLELFERVEFSVRERVKLFGREKMGRFWWFEGLPLASIINGSVYTAHGGLFRNIAVTPVKRAKGKKNRKIVMNSETSSLVLGSLEELSKARRSVLDPPWEGLNLIPGDVLWSDPSMKPGLAPNKVRGIGLIWGPDCTEDFLKKFWWFEGLPLASIINGSVYTAHGGLFRSIAVTPVKRAKGKKNRKIVMNSETSSLVLGSLEELSKARRSVLDPPWEGLNLIPGDVLWSDPSMKPGLAPNKVRGIGLIWGPDCTEDFLKKFQLKAGLRTITSSRRWHDWSDRSEMTVLL
ncbi:hypothetical protein ACLB2K_017268 [Fragaria x ananassa]